MVAIVTEFNEFQFGEMDLDTSDEACSLNVPSASTSSTGYGSMQSSGDRYLTVRRHTVGPGDPAHEQVIAHIFY